MTTFLFVAIILLVNGEDVYDYANLTVTLPKPLRSHISAIYGDDLYVFGGINGTDEDETNYNTKFYRISLSDKFTINAEKNDITSTLSDGDWEILDVTAPTYGPNTKNQFACDSQCSAVIGKYLYIVGAYEFTGGESDGTNTVYRLDLSKDPPEFASESDFQSGRGVATGYAYGFCVVAINDILYTVGGRDPPEYSTELISYDPSEDLEQVISDDVPNPRQYGMCVANVGQSDLYLLGGRSSTSTFGDGKVDYYTLSTGEWTQGSSNKFVGSSSMTRTRCITSLYSNQAECPGGFSNKPVSTSYVFDLGTLSGQSVNLVEGTMFPSVVQYEFYNTGTEGAYIIIVSGGDTSETQNPAIINTIQYSVRYGQITKAPSAAPVPSPTWVTADPTKVPSRSPLCTGCTFPPSIDPTPAPTDGEQPGDDSSAIKLCMVIACVMGILSVVIV